MEQNIKTFIVNGNIKQVLKTHTELDENQNKISIGMHVIEYQIDSTFPHLTEHNLYIFYKDGSFELREQSGSIKYVNASGEYIWEHGQFTGEIVCPWCGYNKN